MAISFILIALVLYGLVPGIVKSGGWFELFFVNTLGMGFNSGLVFYILVGAGKRQENPLPPFLPSRNSEAPSSYQVLVQCYASLMFF